MLWLPELESSREPCQYVFRRISSLTNSPAYWKEECAGSSSKLFTRFRSIHSRLAMMVPTWRICSFGFLALASDQAHWDERLMRDRALDYYTDEIMDNLIRAKNDFLFIHMDIISDSALNAWGFNLSGRSGTRPLNEPETEVEVGLPI
jgi:hypothetical protein